MPKHRSHDLEEDLPEAETKVFRSGNSDAVRLPKGFTDTGMPVRVRKLLNGEILITPLKKRGWPKGFFENIVPLSDDFEVPAREPFDPEYEKRIANLFNDVDTPESE